VRFRHEVEEVRGARLKTISRGQPFERWLDAHARRGATRPGCVWYTNQAHRGQRPPPITGSRDSRFLATGGVGERDRHKGRSRRERLREGEWCDAEPDGLHA